MENTVQITKAEFENLLNAKFDLEMVKDILLSNADISWGGRYLVWNDETTSAVIRHILGNAYDNKREELNKEDGE